MEFCLNENEIVRVKEFRSKHKHGLFSTIGGAFTYIITPTGLEDIVEIQCNQCGEIKDITDDVKWKNA